MNALKDATRTDPSVAAEHGESSVAPIIAAVDASTASRAAVEEAVRLAAELKAPLVFVYVRRGPPSFLGAPFYQRRLTNELERARRVLDRAVRIAEVARVKAEAEILEGSPRRRIAEFAHDRGAQLLVLGSRRRRLGRSVAWAITRTADRPVVVGAQKRSPLALAHRA
jgi:nucleotide-binding universal stress UspA family protein